MASSFFPSARATSFCVRMCFAPETDAEVNNATDLNSAVDIPNLFVKPKNNQEDLCEHCPGHIHVAESANCEVHAMPR